MIVNTTNPANANIGIYMTGEYIKSFMLGALRFCWMIFSSPLPIDTIKNICGVIPTNVAKKKFLTFTLKMQGSTLEITNGIPPINLYAKR